MIYSKANVSKILGISMENSIKARVLVQVDYILTPVSKLKGRRFFPHSCKENKSSYEKEIVFIKYDTGWRVKQ